MMVEMSTFSNGLKVVISIKAKDKSVIENEDLWNITEEPLVNAYSCGWLEDGRCGYTIEANKYQQSPRPIYDLKEQKDKNQNPFVIRKIVGGSRHSLMIMISACENEKKTGQFQHNIHNNNIYLIKSHKYCIKEIQIKKLKKL